MQANIKKSGSGNKGLDWVIILGMIAAYPKTADLLSHFSPGILSAIFGTDMSLLYGMFCALMVEGTILFLHFDRRAHHSAVAQGVKWILIAVSFMCQVFDGFITNDTVSQMTPALKFVLTYGIPALPLIIAVMVASIGALPEDGQTVVHTGLKNRLPNFKQMWNGDGNTVVSPRVDEQIEEIVNPNGKERDTANPTKAGRK